MESVIEIPWNTQYVSMLEQMRRLEAGLVGQKRERHIASSEQLTLDVVSMLVTAPEASPAPSTTVETHERTKPTGRKPLPEKLPRVVIEVLPLDVQREGTEAFDRIGEDVCETVEKRPASVVVVRTVRGKYVSKEKVDALKVGESTPVLQAPAVELPIPRGIAGPGLLADTIVKRWVEHQPLHRMERSYGREGYDVARSTICGWHESVALLRSSSRFGQISPAYAARLMSTSQPKASRRFTRRPMVLLVSCRSKCCGPRSL